MQKSRPKCLPESKGFMDFKGKRYPQFDPGFQVKEQFEPTTANPIRHRQAMAQSGAKAKRVTK